MSNTSSSVAGDGRAQRVGDVAFHLVDGVAQDVVAAVNARLLDGLGGHLVDAELDRHRRADGHVVLGLAVERVARLLRAQVDLGGAALDDRNQEVKARLHDTVELAEALDDGRLLLPHDEQHRRTKGRGPDRRDDEQDEQGKYDHSASFLLG